MDDNKLLLRLSKLSLPQVKSKAKVAFQKFCRLRDANETCISCGVESAKFDGGHFYKAELYTSLMFDEMNCHKQCSYCNSYLAGNLICYYQNLEHRIGKENLTKLVERAKLDKQVDAFGGKPPKLFYIEKYLEYKEKIRILKDNN